MSVFITGTDTNIGKTVVSSWLCLHTGYDYFKPIQAGSAFPTDSDTVCALSGARVHPPAYLFQAAMSPHIAAKKENKRIECEKIVLPATSRLIVEGAGGLLVPCNEQTLMIDFIQHCQLPVIVVSCARLGTINHTLLSIEALRARKIPLWGVLMVGEDVLGSTQAIEHYGQVDIVGTMPSFPSVTREALLSVPMSSLLMSYFQLD